MSHQDKERNNSPRLVVNVVGDVELNFRINWNVTDEIRTMRTQVAQVHEALLAILAANSSSSSSSSNESDANKNNVQMLDCLTQMRVLLDDVILRRTQATEIPSDEMTRIRARFEHMEKTLIYAIVPLV